METLIEMLKYRRPQGSKTQKNFCMKYLEPVMEMDQFGNYIKIIGNRPRVCFTAHHDTVHKEGSFQKVVIEKDDQGDLIASAPNSNCLGADCTTGIWLILEMIKAGVEGVYVVHNAEESGCVGSQDLVESSPDWLNDLDFVISFDRYGYNSIITHQMGSRTASEVFSESLADILDMDHRSDPGGSFTDSNEYAYIVPECTNLSVGYMNQHTSKETQNISYALDLRDALICADWSKLLVDRDPSKEDSFMPYKANRVSSYDDLLYLVENYPQEVADWLDQCGVSPDELSSECGLMPDRLFL